MKVAIFHNFMDNIGGAEVVSLTLARELNADIYTTNIDAEKISALGFNDVVPRIHSLGIVPAKAPFRHQLTFYKFKKLNLKNTYDFYIISGDWAMSGAVHNHPNLWYVHSPLNELWQFKDYVKKEIVSAWKRPIFDMWIWLNRKLTLNYARFVDIWVCNSKNTQGRIKKFYEKHAQVIYPPIETAKFNYKTNDGYWLAVNRLVRHKRIEMQLEAFKQLPNEKLIIVGSYEQGAAQFEQYKNELYKNLPSNVSMLHWVNNEELQKLYANCKGFITTSMDEDFGMTAIEALASGKPVIAPREGGYRESVQDNKTGILIDHIDTQKLVSAIHTVNEKLEKNPFHYKENCISASKQYDTSIFIQKIKNFL